MAAFSAVSASAVSGVSSAVPAVVPLTLGGQLALGERFALGRRLALPFGDVSLTPNLNGLPGGAELQSLTNGLGAWVLVLALVGLLIGAAMWALGSHTQNYQQSFSGRKAVLVSGLAALLIGAGPALVNFFFHAGLKVH
jgi:hypothetical protein